MKIRWKYFLYWLGAKRAGGTPMPFVVFEMKHFMLDTIDKGLK